MNTIIDCKKIREDELVKLKEIVGTLDYTPKLVTFLCDGLDKSSALYVKNKEKTCIEVGAIGETVLIQENMNQQEVEHLIKKYADDNSVDGLLVQFPIFKHLDFDRIVNMIPKNKDVDGFTKATLEDIYKGKMELIPPTPKGVIQVLESIGEKIEGKTVAIIGARGKTFGRYVKEIILNSNGTPILCHSKTPKNKLKEICLISDIIIEGSGQVNIIADDMIKQDTILLNVTIQKVGDEWCSGIDKKCWNKTDRYTKVIGAMGLLTTANLIGNLVQLSIKRRGSGD